MSESKWTLEPWDDGRREPADGSTHEWHEVEGADELLAALNAEDYARACLCVNNCAGLTDAELDALPTLIREAKAQHEAGPAYPAALVEQIAKALRDIAETSADEDDSCIYCGAQPASDHNSVCAAGIAQRALSALRAAESAVGETAKPTCAPCSIPKPTGAPCTSCMRDAFGEEYQRNPDCPNCAKGK